MSKNHLPVWLVGLPVSLLIGVVVLAWSAGCQSESPQANPGALPKGETVDASPRLNAATYFAHGHLLERQGNYEAAAEQYRRALGLSPKMASARNRLGITLNKLGQHAEATAQFRTAIEQNPADAFLRNNLGFSLYLEGKYAEALAALSAALELQPDYGRAHMNKGIVLAKMGDYGTALTEFTLAAGEAEAHYNLGVIQSEQGDYAAAARSLETALRLSPKFDAARQQLHLVSRLAAGTEAQPAPAVAAQLETGLAPEPATPEPQSATDRALVASNQKPGAANRQTAAMGAPAAPAAPVAAPLRSQMSRIPIPGPRDNTGPNRQVSAQRAGHLRRPLPQADPANVPVAPSDELNQLYTAATSGDQTSQDRLKAEIIRRMAATKATP